MPWHSNALASVICGTLGLFLAPLVGGGLGVAFGRLAKAQATRGESDAGGTALVGLIISYMALAIWVLIIGSWIYFSIQFQADFDRKRLQ